MKIEIDHPDDTTLADLERFYRGTGITLHVTRDGKIRGQYKPHRPFPVDTDGLPRSAGFPPVRKLTKAELKERS